MYSNEILDLKAAIDAHIETAQKVDLEREVLRLHRFQSLLHYIDESYDTLMEVINESFAKIRQEIESVTKDQRDHADKMGAVQVVPAQAPEGHAYDLETGTWVRRTNEPEPFRDMLKPPKE